jgi:hypothetical protein
MSVGRDEKMSVRLVSHNCTEAPAWTTHDSRLLVSFLCTVPMIAKASKNIILQAAQFLRKTHETTARQLAGRVFWNGRLQIGCSM